MQTDHIGALAHPLILDPLAWAALRVMTGLSVAGCYTVVEAWLQAKVTNQTRGRVLGIYRVVDLGASLIAQLMIGVLEPASYVSYNILAILCCASLLPLMLIRVPAPASAHAATVHREIDLARQLALGRTERRRIPLGSVHIVHGHESRLYIHGAPPAAASP